MTGLFYQHAKGVPLSQSSNLWSSDEISFLMTHFEELSTEGLAQALDRSVSSIRVQACRLDLSARNGRERAFNTRKLKAARLAFLRNPCMVTPSSKVGEYWSPYIR